MARLAPSRRAAQRNAAVVASTTKSAFSVYTRWIVASAQKLGATASSSAAKTAATGRIPSWRQRRWRRPHASAPHAALKMLRRQATEPNGKTIVHAFPSST